MSAAGRITVISGLPRSGTSLMMQMLAAGGVPVLTDGVRRADVDNPRGYFELEAVKRTGSDASWVATAAGQAVKVAHLLLPRLPLEHDYRVILMRRDLREVVASQRAMLARLGRPGAQLSAERLAEVYAAQLESAERWLHSQPRFRTLQVEHAACIRQPGAVAIQLAGFLELPLDVPAMAAAVDPSLHRQRQTA